MARTIKGGTVGSVKKLRSNLKKSSGGAGFYTRIPEDGSVVGRFLTEPDLWVSFYEHYDPVRKYFPCSDDCDGCAEGDNPSQRYLANFVDVDENKVIPLLLSKTLASSLLKKYDKFGTMVDRDYELSRTGSGMDVEYDAIPEAPSKMNVSRYDPIDLWELVENQLPSDDDDDDEEDEKPRRRSGRKGSARSERETPRRRPRPRDEDDDDDDDDEDEDEAPRRRPRSRTSGTKSSSTKSSGGMKRRRRA